VREALVVLWEASDRVCGKRLKAMVPLLVPSLERHGPGPDRGQYVIARDDERWWCFVRRDGDGNFVGSTADGWLEPSFVARLMAAR
jgi:hypothetical protein